MLLNEAVGAPVITDFSPSAGAPGDQISVIGSGFSSGGFIVRFWNGGAGVVSDFVAINSDTLLTVTVPSGIITGPISIQQGAGTPSYSVNDFAAIGYGPYITGFSPLYGSSGSSVIITGIHLTNTFAVLFNGTNATEVTANAAGTQITTRVPPAATSGPITVSTIYGSSNTPSAFTVVGPGPFITGFSPVSGDAGTKVLISGLHFTGVTNVTFNGQPGIILTANSDTLLQVAAPLGLTTGPITVYTSLGSAVTSSNFFGIPTLTGFSPFTGRAGTNVLISGSNFTGATGVSFGGVFSTNFTVLNNTNIKASVPTGAASGNVRVNVPGASALSTSNFVVKPTITGFSPAFGPPGTSVTLSGANFNVGTPTVRFNGVATATPTGIGFGQLIVQVPSATSTGPISITTSDGSYTNSSLFFLPAAITSFSPTNTGPGTRVLITGQNFTGAMDVTFGGILASDFTVSNNTLLSATVPANVLTGPISVITPAGAASSIASFYGAPRITSFTPTHGLPGTNVTISGVNFLGGAVQFNGLAATVLSLNNTQLVAKVPSGAQTGPITVLAPAGTNASAALFTLDYILPAPLLSIGLLDNQVHISWPAALSNYSLQFQNTFSTNPNWQSVTGMPVISGGLETITESNVGPTRFYRLLK